MTTNRRHGPFAPVSALRWAILDAPRLEGRLLQKNSMIWFVSRLVLGGLVLAGPAYAQTRPVCAEVVAAAGDGPAVARALAERGIPSPREGCTAVRVEASTGDVWTVHLPHGVVAAREISSPEVGAMWVDSLIRPSRLEDLLPPQVPPPSQPPATPIAAPPAGITLYASFEAWRARAPVGIVEGSLAPRAVSAPLVGEEGLEPMWAVDRKMREARDDGRVFAFEADGEIYVHDGSPRAHKGAPFGRLVSFGDRGLFQREACHWVQTAPSTGFVTCEVALRLLDLETGEVTPLTRARLAELVAVDPALAEAWEAAAPKHAGAMRTFALKALAAGGR